MVEGELKKRIHKLSEAYPPIYQVCEKQLKEHHDELGAICLWLDEAKQDFSTVVIGNSFENPSPEVIAIRSEFYNQEIKPKIKKWFGE